MNVEILRDVVRQHPDHRIHYAADWRVGHPLPCQMSVSKYSSMSRFKSLEVFVRLEEGAGTYCN